MAALPRRRESSTLSENMNSAKSNQNSRLPPLPTGTPGHMCRSGVPGVPFLTHNPFPTPPPSISPPHDLIHSATTATSRMMSVGYARDPPQLETWTMELNGAEYLILSGAIMPVSGFKAQHKIILKG